VGVGEIGHRRLAVPDHQVSRRIERDHGLHRGRGIAAARDWIASRPVRREQREMRARGATDQRDPFGIQVALMMGADVPERAFDVLERGRKRERRG